MQTCGEKAGAPGRKSLDVKIVRVTFVVSAREQE
jgi:hypothetical protein